MNSHAVAWMLLACANFWLPVFDVCVDQDRSVGQCPENPSAEALESWHAITVFLVAGAFLHSALYWHGYPHAPQPGVRIGNLVGVGF